MSDNPKKIVGGLVFPVPDEKRCQARNRRGERCGRHATPGYAVCLNHGSRSTGPKTPEGRERIRQRSTKHGRYSQAAKIERLFVRVEEALQCGREWYLENRRHKALWSAWYGLMAWLRGFTVAEIRASIAR
jgi:hypothetical protein